MDREVEKREKKDRKRERERERKRERERERKRKRKRKRERERERERKRERERESERERERVCVSSQNRQQVTGLSKFLRGASWNDHSPRICSLLQPVFPISGWLEPRFNATLMIAPKIERCVVLQTRAPSWKSGLSHQIISIKKIDEKNYSRLLSIKSLHAFRGPLSCCFIPISTRSLWLFLGRPCVKWVMASYSRIAIVFDLIISKEFEVRKPAPRILAESASFLALGPSAEEECVVMAA